jgi:hypothetical protein
MVIVALFLFAFGVYWYVVRWHRKQIPEDDRQFGARVGRSLHAAVPLPGVAGQAPPDFMFEPYKESVGPEESHTLVLDEKGRPIAAQTALDSTLGPYRDPDVAAKREEKGKMKKRKKAAKAPLPFVTDGEGR